MSSLADSAGWWPYLILALVGFLPSEIWRVAAAVLSRWVDDGSEVFTLIRLVAAALVAAVVAKLLVQPPPALAPIPAWGRVTAIGCAIGVYFVSRRSVPTGIAVGSVMIVVLAMLHAP